MNNILLTPLACLQSWRNVDLLLDLALFRHKMIRGHRALRGAKAGGAPDSEMRRGRNVFFCTKRDIETKTLQKTNISIALS
jgi:hypothetical protein